MNFSKYYTRDTILRSIRQFLWNEGFCEVETPLLVPSVIPESYLDIFTTTLFNRYRKPQKMFLTASPESTLKKLLVEGIGNCFEITRSFRNTETDATTHSPEFTILEFYRVNANYMDIAKDCERLFQYIYIKSLKRSENNRRTVQGDGIFQLTYQGKSIDLSSPWIYMSVKDAFEKYTEIPFDQITNKKGKTVEEMFNVNLIKPFAKKKGYTISRDNTWEELFNQFFLNEVEPYISHLEKPVILFDYPRPMAALATVKKEDPRFSERFEIYAGGLEIGDCYNELRDAKEQENRFKFELKEIKRRKKTEVVPDMDFIAALQKGLPKCSGIAIGIDRLVMLFTDAKEIKEIRFCSF
ncbi:EF-P lysine aminoacylase GenX [Candidatus Gottesmanbacteria bacterium RIFCSPHIGHO2_02_FULL_39_11]|uniref:EF-P lysine aminoacylase GenX n=1 Tax=Candidatus Gottesmanbacteria bacterium RIFCSPHIGHO2_02_FULL_39_11 TaxID=1798382 RepID=A0A1F5ZUH2_9BACT|nr:MAG: EF-P lysine aminoacylase GenX [Candidatus Gottesmanbacteria bacterium RIFCSPHIGHO2_02_FULL_39_11]